MSLSSTTSRVDYVGTGSTSVYPYTFRIFAESDLRVIVRDTDDVETILELDTDYSVSGVGDASGGSITLLDGNLVSGYALTIRRVRPLTQETDIRNQGDFYPEAHEDTFDHLAMVDQQQQEELDRSIKLPESVSASGVSMELGVPVGGTILGWNDDGTAITTVDPANVGAGAGSLPPGRAIVSDGSGNVSASAVTDTELEQLSGITSDALGSSDVQNVSNKTFTDGILATEIATPSTPASGKARLYPKADGK
jgi:hypothetical protein